MFKVQRPPHSHMLMHSLHYRWQCGFTAVKKEKKSTLRGTLQMRLWVWYWTKVTFVSFLTRYLYIWTAKYTFPDPNCAVAVIRTACAIRASVTNVFSSSWSPTTHWNTLLMLCTICICCWSFLPLAEILIMCVWVMILFRPYGNSQV